jgi:polysaccharide export outer membrane protein
LIFGLVACSAWDGLPQGASSDPAEDPVSTEDLKIASGDKVHLTVFGEDSITDDYDIGTDGFIAVPLAGRVKADGVRIADLEKAIASKLSDLLKDPRVTIAITGFRPFYIIGEVEKPGEYQFRSGLNVISAMAVAGGNTYRANRTRVLIQRGGVGEFQTYPMSPEVKVYPGDLIKVPERFF